MRKKVRMQSTSAICLMSIAKFFDGRLRKMLKRWWGRPRQAADGDRVRRGRDGNETGGPGYETGDNTTATGGVMYTDDGELEFDEDEMAALEGQRLVAEFRCGIY